VVVVSSIHAEGPVYIPADGSVLWSDVKGDRLFITTSTSLYTIKTKTRGI
jgi:sugar lactone lactonase YvrE